MAGSRLVNGSELRLSLALWGRLSLSDQIALGLMKQSTNAFFAFANLVAELEPALIRPDVVGLCWIGTIHQHNAFDATSGKASDEAAILRSQGIDRVSDRHCLRGSALRLQLLHDSGDDCVEHGLVEICHLRTPFDWRRAKLF